MPTKQSNTIPKINRDYAFTFQAEYEQVNTHANKVKLQFI